MSNPITRTTVAELREALDDLPGDMVVAIPCCVSGPSVLHPLHSYSDFVGVRDEADDSIGSVSIVAIRVADDEDYFTTD